MEKLIDEFKDNKKDLENSRSRLKAVDHEETVQRKVGVQHKPSARLVKSKFTRPCNTCCCLSHCEKNSHTDEHDVQVDLSALGVPEVKVVVYDGMLDRSWNLEVADYEYETELLDSLPLVQDNFMSMLCSVNTDLKVENVEDMQAASTDKIMV